MGEARLFVVVFLGLVLLEAVCPHRALADTLVVLPDGGGDFPTIQAAIVAANDGDIVELGDGTFTGDGNYNIDFLGKAITVRSVSRDPETCVIDCLGMGRGFTFQSGEGPLSALEGVTITRGGATYFGGGIFCMDSSPTLQHVILLENALGSSWLHGCAGGGMFCEDGSPSLTDVSFIRNILSGAGPYAATVGGGMYCSRGAPTLTDVVFLENQAGSDYGRGGGLFFDDCGIVVTNAVFCGNRGTEPDGWEGRGGGVWSDGPAVFQNVAFQDNYPEAVMVSSGSPVFSHATFRLCDGGMRCKGSPHLANVTFWKNRDYAIYWDCEGALTVENSIVAKTRLGPAITMAYYGSTDITLTCCDLYGNAGGDWVGCIADQYGVDGNISLDALICDPWAGDFTLHDNSPCAPFEPPNSGCDLIGAWPVGCGPSATQAMSWGSIKAMYR